MPAIVLVLVLVWGVRLGGRGDEGMGVQVMGGLMVCGCWWDGGCGWVVLVMVLILFARMDRSNNTQTHSCSAASAADANQKDRQARRASHADDVKPKQVT